jgi:hypothetical protein
VTIRTGDAYDVFLSHASEDKTDFVVPLAEALAVRGVRVWFDKQQLMLGDSLSRKIDEGLALSRFGAVVLSPAFFAKEWPQRELDGLVARETALGVKVILPIWHKITRDEILKFSPTLAGKLAARTSDGLEAIADQICEVLAGPVDSGQVISEPAPEPEAPGSSSATPAVTTALQPDSTAAAVRSAVVEQRLPELRAEVSKRVSAAKHDLNVASDFAASIEAVAALGGSLALLAPDDAVTYLAITAPHRIFDAAHDERAIAASWSPMLTAIRALGALLTRLELWAHVRMLANHQPPTAADRLYPGWICWMEVQVASRRNAPNNAEHYRQPLRDAAQMIARIPELGQDTPDENTRLNSVIAFDFLSRLVEADNALHAGRPVEAYPNFAHFDSGAVRPFTRRVAEGTQMTNELLPGRSKEEILQLLGVVESQAQAARKQTGFWAGIADGDLQAAIEQALAGR